MHCNDSFQPFEVGNLICAWYQFAYVKEGGSGMISMDVATDQSTHCARFSRNAGQRYRDIASASGYQHGTINHLAVLSLPKRLWDCLVRVHLRGRVGGGRAVVLLR